VNIDQMVNFLEQQGFSDEGIDDYLEHFGKMGMHWGQRSKTQKLGITGAGLVGGAIGSGLILNKLAAKNPKVMYAALPLQAAIGIAGGIAAGRMLDRQGKTKLSDAKLHTSKTRKSTTGEKALVIGTGAIYAAALFKSFSMIKKIM
jgi:hypothetical protein